MLEELVAAHREPCLRGRRPVSRETGSLVEDRHIGKPDAGIAGRSLDRSEHRADAAVIRLVVQVVEFGDGRIARLEHLDVSLAGDRCDSGGIDGSGEPVHAVAPGPEVVPAGGTALLGVTRQRSLEGVAVRVHEARQQHADPCIAALRGNPGGDLPHPSGIDDEADIVRPAVGQQGLCCEDRIQDVAGCIYNLRHDTFFCR